MDPSLSEWQLGLVEQLELLHCHMWWGVTETDWGV